MSQNLLHAIVSAVHIGGHRLHLKFDDATEGDVDLSRLVKYRGLLAALKDPAYVALVQIEPEGGTVIWPNGADLDEVVLYCAVKGVPVPRYEDERVSRSKASTSSRRRRTAS